jgi:two-component system OmpR family response regulator
MKILIVEDDAEIRALVQHALKSLTSDFEFSINASNAIQKIDNNSYHLVVLDLNLENSDGRTVLKHLSLRSQQIPVIILSGSNGIEDRIQGLGLGADDYISKPFSGIELHLRAAGILRRTTRYEDIIHLGDIKLNRLKRDVYCHGKKTDFQTREFKVLEFFMNNPDKIIPKHVLVTQIWGLHFTPHTNVVDVMICRIRSKIERQGITRQLETIRGGGYIFHSFTKKALPTKNQSYSELASWP